MSIAAGMSSMVWSALGVSSETLRGAAEYVVAVPAKYRAAASYWRLADRAAEKGFLTESVRLKGAVSEWMQKLAPFVEASSSFLAEKVKSGDLDLSSFEEWGRSVADSAGSMSEAVGKSRGLGVVPIVAMVVFGLLLVFSTLAGLLVSRYVEASEAEKQAASQAAIVSQLVAAGVPITPEIVDKVQPKPSGGVSARELGVGALVALGVVVFLVTRKR